MTISVESSIVPFVAPRAASRRALSPSQALALLLHGSEGDHHELPALGDLATALLLLARGKRRKVLLPLGETTGEFALLRQGSEVLVSLYDTGPEPWVRVLDRSISLESLLRTCALALAEEVVAESDPLQQRVLQKLAEQTTRASIRHERVEHAPAVVRKGGTLQDPGHRTALAFGFSAAFLPSSELPSDGPYAADVHALLFQGSLWTFIRGHRVLLDKGPIMLTVQRLVDAVARLIDAASRASSAHLRFRAGRSQVTLRLSRQGRVRIGFALAGASPLILEALSVREVALPILRLASELSRASIAVDRAQARNLRMRAFRDEVRRLRRSLSARGEKEGFVNADPDRLRLKESVEEPAPTYIDSAESRHLRFSERWLLAVDGLDSSSTFFCGDRLVLATEEHVVALSRDQGEMLWSHRSEGSSVMMAGKVLMTLERDGLLQLRSVEDGDSYASTRLRLSPLATLGCSLPASAHTPPIAVLEERGRGLVAIDLRHGEARWHFECRQSTPLRLRRAGRLVLVASGEGVLQAIDIVSGEVVWRFRARGPFACDPGVSRDLVHIVAQQGSEGSVLFGLELYSGELLWQRRLDASPTTAPIAAGPHTLLTFGSENEAVAAAFSPEKGELRWMVPDPGIGQGAATLPLDDLLLAHAQEGSLSALRLHDGELHWSHRLFDPLVDDVPRRLEPVLRGGALFVPANSVRVLRPADGRIMGNVIASDLVPDLIRVDERGWVYIVEDSGRLAAYAPLPQLTLVVGGRG